MRFLGDHLEECGLEIVERGRVEHGGIAEVVASLCGDGSAGFSKLTNRTFCLSFLTKSSSGTSSQMVSSCRIVLFKLDHGGQRGSRRLRSKGRWNNQETMCIPRYTKAPGITEPWTATGARSIYIDLARRIAGFGGVDVGDAPALVEESLSPGFDDQSAIIRGNVLFAQERPWYAGEEHVRHATLGIFDGRSTYCR